MLQIIKQKKILQKKTLQLLSILMVYFKDPNKAINIGFDNFMQLVSNASMNQC